MVQIGSTIFRSECGATRSVFAAAPRVHSARERQRDGDMLQQREAMTLLRASRRIVGARATPAPHAPARTPRHDWLFFSTFQNTGAGAVGMPSMFLRVGGRPSTTGRGTDAW